MKLQRGAYRIMWIKEKLIGASQNIRPIENYLNITFHD